MLTITGEVRKILDDSYSDKRTKKIVRQAVLVLEPEDQAQNFEIELTSSQLDSGAEAEWQKLIGKQASVAVSLYINYEYKFHRYTAVTGKPIRRGSKHG